MGEVVDSKYGSAYNLKGELPLLSSHRYSLPKLTQDRKRVEEIIEELMDKFRFLWPAGRDPENRARVALALLFTSYENPCWEWDRDPELRAATEFWLAAFVLDDIVDSVLRIEDGLRNYRIVLTFVQKFSNFEEDGIEFEQFIPGFENDPNSPMYYFGIALRAFRKSVGAFGKLAAQDDASIEYFFEEFMSAGVAHYFVIAAKSGEETKFSNLSFSKHIGQHLHAMRLAVGIDVLITPAAKLPIEMKNTLLFRMMMDSYGNITSLCNAIVGFKRDIRKDTWEDTIILRNVREKNWTLQEAFDFTLADYKSEVHDMNMALTILQETYGDIDGVDEVLQVISDTCNGICVTYTDAYAIGRYGLHLEFDNS